MKRVIVDYNKLTNEILTLLLERFPDGYDDSHIIRFRNAQNELVEAVEVRTDDTIYLVKVSTKLASRLEKFDDDNDNDIDDEVEPIDTMKDMDIEDDDVASDEEDDDLDDVDKPEKDLDADDDDDDDDDFDDDKEYSEADDEEDDDEDDR